MANRKGAKSCQPQANTILTSLLASPGQTTTDFNPYILGPQEGAEKIFGVFIQNSTHQFYNLVPKIDGALFSLPGGDLRVAVGGEYLKTEYLHNSLYSAEPHHHAAGFPRCGQRARCVVGVR